MSIKTVPPVSSGLGTFDARFGVPRPYGFITGIGGDFESIDTVTVGSGGATIITFSNIPGTYQHLQLRWIGRSTRSTVTTDSFRIQFNSDTNASNYVRYHLLYGTGSTVGVEGSINTGTPSVIVGVGTASGASANTFGVGCVDLLDYASTSKNKVTRGLFGYDLNGSGGIYVGSGMWINTAAVTSLTASMENGNFVQYSQVALYGVKAP